MSATGIVFLALSVVMLGLGFYGASVDVVSATGLAESIGQMKNFYFLLGGLILFIVLYRLALGKASLRVQHTMSTTIRYVILIGVGVFMVYPLLWMISATFKDNNEIFSTLSLIPTRPTMEGYKAAMNNYGGDINIWQAMLNTYKYVIPKVIFTVVSSTITAYGFGRFRFRGRNFLFAVLMATLFLPQVVLNIPQFLMYRQFGWVDSPYYLALIAPTLFAQETYFVYMLIQFMRNIPRELDEAAKIDGASSWQQFKRITLPLLTPTTFYLIVTGMIGSLQTFLEVNLFAPDGGRGYGVGSIVFYIWQKAFDSSQMGYACACATVFGVAMIILTAVQFTVSRKWVYEGE